MRKLGINIEAAGLCLTASVALTGCTGPDGASRTDRPDSGITTVTDGASSTGATTGISDSTATAASMGGTMSTSGTSGGVETSTAGDVSTGASDVTGGETAEPGTGGIIPTGCDAVDLLFVVDNSISMTSEQEALAEAFPGFADTIIAALPPDINLHVGVTSTTFENSNFAVGDGTCTGSLGGSPADATDPTPYCNVDADCGMDGVCRPQVPQFGESSPMAGACGYEPVHYYAAPTDSMNVGNGTHGTLYNTGGLSYYEISTNATPAEIADLQTWFAGAAQIGNQGSQIEFPLAGAAWALDAVANPGNAGFLRDEGAVLVVFFLTDEPDQTPESVRVEMLDKFADAKAGCGGWDCIVGGGFVVDGCSAETPIGEFFSNLPTPPMTAEFPFDPTNMAPVDPEIFEPVLSNALAQVIVDTCEAILPG